MGDGTEFNDVLLGLPGFRLTAVSEERDELLVSIETIRWVAGCGSCGVIARTKDRLRVLIRDLSLFDRRVRLFSSKRRLSCPDTNCPQSTGPSYDNAGPLALVGRVEPVIRPARI